MSTERETAAGARESHFVKAMVDSWSDKDAPPQLETPPGAKARSGWFGTATGALFRIAQGVERPQEAAVFALRLIGCDDLAALAEAQAGERAPQPRSTEGAEAIAAIRDDVLYQRGPLAENGMTSEQVNDVLAVIDSHTPASPPVPQEREELVERLRRLEATIRDEAAYIDRADIDNLRALGIKRRLLAALASPAEASEPEAWMVERQKEGEWRWVGASNHEDEAERFAQDERRAGSPARVVPLYRRAERAEPDGAVRRAWDIHWLQNILDRAKEGEPSQAEPAWAYDRLIVLASSLLDEVASAPQRAEP